MYGFASNYIFTALPVECKEGAPVTRDGKRIGKVISCKKQDDKYVVTMRLDKGVDLELGSVPMSMGTRTEDNEHD